MKELLEMETELPEERAHFLLNRLKEEALLSEEGLEEYQYQILIDRLVEAELESSELTLEQVQFIISGVKDEHQWNWWRSDGYK